jgi:hypothetical protein
MKAIIVSDFKSVAIDGSNAHTQAVIHEDGCFEIQRLRIQKNEIPLIGTEVIIRQFSTCRAIAEGMAFKGASIERIVNDLSNGWKDTVIVGLTVVVVVVVVVVGTAVTLMVTVPVVAELYVESEAFDAETVHEPTDDVDNTAPDNEQLADPADTSEYVTAPVPEPPDVASVRLVPNIVAVAAKVSVACVSFETVMVTVPVEIEL